MKLTKAEVIAHCREVFNDPSWPYERGDSIAKREYFNDYTDALCKDRMITEHQYNTWTNPF